MFEGMYTCACKMVCTRYLFMFYCCRTPVKKPLFHFSSELLMLGSNWLQCPHLTLIPSTCDYPMYVPVTNCCVTWRAVHQKTTTRARYSSSIESKYKFEYKYGLRSYLRAPNFKHFSGGACPQTPLTCTRLRMHHHQCPPPPILSTSHHLCYGTLVNFFTIPFECIKILLILSKDCCCCTIKVQSNFSGSKFIDHFGCTTTCVWKSILGM